MKSPRAGPKCPRTSVMKTTRRMRCLPLRLVTTNWDFPHHMDQDEAYRDSVLPPTVSARVTVEAGSPLGWSHYAGRTGVVVGMHSFGLSAPIAVVAEHFGFTVDRVVGAAKQAIAAG